MEVDFGVATIYIKHKANSKNDDQGTKRIKFIDLISCEFQEAKCKDDCIKPFVYSFTVKTGEREFKLYTDKQVNRQVWLNAFNYIIITTREVQQIIKVMYEE